jgi:hypothetical protein
VADRDEGPIDREAIEGSARSIFHDNSIDPLRDCSLASAIQKEQRASPVRKSDALRFDGFRTTPLLVFKAAVISAGG